MPNDEALKRHILERVRRVVYRLAIPSGLLNVHNVFHDSRLHKYESDPSHVLNGNDEDSDD